ncbi:MAG TPA: metallophosphoesterase [Candidatus Megaira endosymbiont of Nemacystus decipiens]|nr:metallophosphoesterase [Candidatus Megaera endosymbiont of Nemacystus decipiens]
MKLAWVTDIHLNFLESAEREGFYQDIVATNSNAVLVSGDIAEAPTVSDILEEMARHIAKPIYFVLGNHDYYQSSVENVRQKVTQLSQKNSSVNWLPETGLVKLNKDTLLLGEDCWADGRYGNYADSRVMLNDSRMIQELREGNIIGKYQLLDAMQKLADNDAKRLENNLHLAIQEHLPKKIIVLVHVPPFKESCMHEGEISNDDYLPFFASKITGDVLLGAAKANPKIEFLVLCGHTHSSSYYKPLDNLTVKAGSVVYGKPIVQEVIEL